MSTTRMRTPARKPALRTLEEVNQELEEGLAVYQQERNLFQKLITLAGGRLDHGLQFVVLDRIHEDEMALRGKAALEVRTILAQTDQ